MLATDGKVIKLFHEGWDKDLEAGRRRERQKIEIESEREA